jgi:hypothetical protein
MKHDLLLESQTAEKEDVIHGVPAGILSWRTSVLVSSMPSPWSRLRTFT